MTDSKAKTVLIVEDTEDLAIFVKLALEELGLEAFHTNTPAKAINFLESRKADLIILDIGLPEMSGWELLEIINDRRKADNISIVVTTAFSDPANRLVGKLQAVDAYLFKPFQFAELRKVVNDVLGLA